MCQEEKLIMTKINEKFRNALPTQEKVYYKTYFHIDAGYKWGEGMAPELRDRFYGEMMDLFAKAGWQVSPPQSPTTCPTVQKNGNELYCHPMELTGPCEESIQEEVQTILEFAETCHLRSIDIKSQVYAVTDDQYRSALEIAKPDIERDIMDAFQTPSKMQFFPGYYAKLDEVAAHYHVKTLLRDTVITSSDPHMVYIHDVVQDLLEKGKIICKANETHGKMYRAATGPELLELARKQACLESVIQQANQRISSMATPTSKEAGKDR